MNQGQKNLLIWGIFVIIYILIIAAFHWWLDSDVFIIALGLCGIVFMGKYFHNVHLAPLDRSIGRLEGEHKCLIKVRKIFDEKKKKQRKK